VEELRERTEKEIEEERKMGIRMKEQKGNDIVGERKKYGERRERESEE